MFRNYKRVLLAILYVGLNVLILSSCTDTNNEIPYKDEKNDLVSTTNVNESSGSSIPFIKESESTTEPDSSTDSQSATESDEIVEEITDDDIEMAKQIAHEYYSNTVFRDRIDKITKIDNVEDYKDFIHGGYDMSSVIIFKVDLIDFEIPRSIIISKISSGEFEIINEGYPYIE
jgi:hypothetical protein